MEAAHQVPHGTPSAKRRSPCLNCGHRHKSKEAEWDVSEIWRQDYREPVGQVNLHQSLANPEAAFPQMHLVIHTQGFRREGKEKTEAPGFLH
ncbi:hypothetical protein [Candidatus Methylacidithermus pantelleriae]|uniref:Uncharacterized protein n=1 Tax=Candidatus Methylacidithermus pantelleriae TaxID=2744239 RepID=A0A8J2FNI1_9BACT|nr:hypothetical protein [Candidatus Methylacidithermus pantelleriae]CAF0692539.1 hypothetical protein MPNT_120051 [Candidatus Methylacidithermus pantelleriae]